MSEAKHSPLPWRKIVAGFGITADVVDADGKTLLSVVRDLPRDELNVDLIVAAVNERDTLRAELAALRETQRWVPISEQLPDNRRELSAGHLDLERSRQTAIDTAVQAERERCLAVVDGMYAGVKLDEARFRVATGKEAATVDMDSARSLRYRTGAGLMDCTNALLRHCGDVEAAYNDLQTTGLA